MQEKHLFEYAVIRIVPKVEREEFLNAGVILYCAKQRFLQVMVLVNMQRLNVLCNEEMCLELQQNLQALTSICKGEKGAGPIARLDIASRFRWLTATRSTVIQTSKVHPGLCDNPLETLNKLYTQLVL